MPPHKNVPGGRRRYRRDGNPTLDTVGEYSNCKALVPERIHLSKRHMLAECIAALALGD